MPFLGKTPSQIVDPEVDIDGGTIDGVSIGSVTADAGAFTNLTATGTLTLPDDGISGDDVNGGTISNFASTGIDDNADATAITIDSSERVGINNNAPFNKLDIKSSPTTELASAESQLSLRNGNGRATYVTFDNSADLTIYNTAAGDASGGDTVFHQTSGEAMRIKQDGKVGIGTISPSSYNGAGDDLVIKSDGYTGMSIVSPTDRAGTIYFADGTSGSETYRGFVEYNHTDDEFKIGTAGNARMYVNNTGNVGIGEDDPSVKLHVNGGGSNTLALFESTDAGAAISFKDGNTTTNPEVDCRTNDLTFNTGGSERMRVTSSGNIGIGDDNPPAGTKVAIQHDGTAIRLDGTAATTKRIFFRNTNAANPAEIVADGALVLITEDSGMHMEFKTANTERMRIDASGNLLVGRYNASYGTGTTGCWLHSNGRGLFECTGDSVLALNRQDGSNYRNVIQFYRANSLAGVIQAQAGSAPQFVGNSDATLKGNVVDHESELQNVMALRPVRWDWLDEELGSGEGFIAQEVQETPWRDLVRENEDGKLMLAGLGAVETRLIKALQEAVTRIETLEAEVAALKGE